MRRIILSTFCLLLMSGSAFAQDTQLTETLELLTWTAGVYPEQRDCFSCHHQTMPSLALKQAHRQGLEVDLEEIERQIALTARFFEPRIPRMLKGEGVPGKSFTAGYALWLFEDNQRPADKTTDAMVAYLRQRQQEDGHWRIGTKRPPIEYTDFTATALAVRGLRDYGRPLVKTQTSPETPASSPLSDAERIAKAQQWLIATPAKNQEARTFKLLGLLWSDADRAEIDKVVEEIIQQQRPEGGWSQEKEMQSDAYATGQILFALLKADAGKTYRDAIDRGIAWLKSTRLPDGSWFVQTRSKPIQTYFESGFPHDKSQFISTAATSWAALAILLVEAEGQ
ncbi:MAG: terpene cyclase/mutase family protein [Planctomycetaceae bacterium]|nr:terpene cyclase/mutase family protein [Planctomycetaceae bacterium]